MNILFMASGGDSQGMNFCFWQMAKKLFKQNIFICESGLEGLIDNKIKKLDLKYFSLHKYESGVCIKTSRSKRFLLQKYQKQAINNLEKNDIKKIVMLGGNGSFLASKELAKHVELCFVPATIDNDFELTNYCLGHDTAVTNAVEYILQCKNTLACMSRTGIFEVMGRNSPQLAKNVAQKVDADLLVYQNFVSVKCNYNKNILETQNLTIQSFANILKQIKTKQSSPIIVMQENIFVTGKPFEHELEKLINSDITISVIGVIQRGGVPTKTELLFAKKFANAVVKNINNSKSFVVIEDNKKIKIINY
ncbi:MAG: 6-phosphofructokinase [Clostridia bacterium]